MSTIKKKLLSELDKCARCGACRAVCPIFKDLSNESLVARGRLALIKAALENDLTVSRHLTKIVDCCLLCLRCRENCPSLVDTGKVIQSARNWLANKRGLPLPMRFGFRMVLPHKKIYDFFMGVFRLGQKLFFWRKIKPSGKTLRHIPFVFLNLFTLSTHVPRLRSKPGLQILPGSFRGRKKLKVAIFSGCLNNYVYPQILEATIDVLKKSGISFILPREQLCCGTPALVYGDTATARRLAIKNIRALQPEKVDVVLTACSSCGRMLKDEYPALYRGQSDTGRLVQHLKNKVMDVMEFLKKYTDHPLAKQSVSTTYHVPCHAIWNKSAELTRSLLKDISDYRTTDKEDLCCGGGGAFSFKYQELGLSIGQTKIASLLKNPVDQLITGCPGCMMQLTWLLQKAGANQIRVAHAIEFYRNSLK
ncbi:MAG: (Fe-S)-binding protein [Planctomycetes bacterium]|nr:(Fe-S)-binding protein [Planctomycetota bacterium]